MKKELIAILEGKEVGRVERDTRGKISFAYNKDWQSDSNAHPLSLSMPLPLTRHGNEKIDPFLWGLLPDNEATLGRWAQKYQVSARNSFGLVGAVGEDCAGAVQFVRPERLDAILEQKAPDIEWLDEAGVAERFRALRQDSSAWRIPSDTGQFSLAGAQPKTALLLQDGRWGVPSGRVPTTHILKPPSLDFDGHAENEHFCLELARSLGIPVADSKIMQFQDEIAIVVKRYDRIELSGELHRIHQEDMCQALAIYPHQKYQNEGGPGIKEIVDLLRIYSVSVEEDVTTFLDAIAFNWLIVGTDAHAKNYALLIASGGQVRLAPLYDVASALPYPQINIEKTKLSMKLGGEYRFRNIGAYHWRKMAAENKLDPDQLIQRVKSFAKDLSDHVSETHRRMKEEGINNPIMAKLAKSLKARASACQKVLS